MWHHVAPQVGRRGVAVREDDGIAVALVDIGHPVSVDLAIAHLPVRFCPDHVYLLICSFPFLWTSGSPKRAYRVAFIVGPFGGALNVVAAHCVGGDGYELLH